jgi:hypothetical protein
MKGAKIGRTGKEKGKLRRIVCAIIKIRFHVSPPARLLRPAQAGWAPAAGGVLGDSAGRRVRASVEDVFAIDVLSARGESAAVLATGVALFEAVQLEFYGGWVLEAGILRGKWFMQRCHVRCATY